MKVDEFMLSRINVLVLVGVKSAVFDKEIVTINSQEGKRMSVKSPK